MKSIKKGDKYMYQSARKAGAYHNQMFYIISSGKKFTTLGPVKHSLTSQPFRINTIDFIEAINENIYLLIN